MLWIITPDGKRVLYSDPGEAAEEVLTDHGFNRTVDAEIRYKEGTRSIEVQMKTTDGTTLESTGTIGRTLGTHILNAVIRLTPEAILRSSAGTTISAATLNFLVAANGLIVAGCTETDRRYRLDADRVERITDASATLNGTELGAAEPPFRPIEFGDTKTTADALYIPGTLHLERPG